MTRKLFACLMFALLLIPAARATQAAPRTTNITMSPVAGRIVELVNGHRRVAGLPPVTVNPTLMVEAQRFSAVQAGLGRLSHRGNDGTTAGQRFTRAGYNWRYYGENLAAGQTTAERVVAAWMTSPTHRAVMLHAQMTEIGIGHTWRASDPSRYMNYYTLEVARPR